MRNYLSIGRRDSEEEKTRGNAEDAGRESYLRLEREGSFVTMTFHERSIVAR